MTNAELAQKLRDLRDFIVIAGYEESHATRYTHIARAIEHMAEPVMELRRTGRLQEIPGVGKTIQTYIKEILDQGYCSKQKDWEPYAPLTVLELLQVPGIGTHLAREMLLGYGIASLEGLRQASAAGVLDQIYGMTPKLKTSIQEFLENHP